MIGDSMGPLKKSNAVTRYLKGTVKVENLIKYLQKSFNISKDYALAKSRTKPSNTVYRKLGKYEDFFQMMGTVYEQVSDGY